MQADEPRGWSQRNQTGPNRYPATIPINIDLSLALGAWVGDPGAAVPIVPQAKIFLPKELAALGYL